MKVGGKRFVFSFFILILSLLVITAIGGGFYLFSENSKRTKKLETESYCKNDFTYKLRCHPG